MTIYAIGDVQGCYEPLRYLLEKIQVDWDTDELWFVGDLINRGPQSLETLRFVKGLGAQATSVLGNHDLHLLAIMFGGFDAMGSDTFQDVIDAPDCEELCDWLRTLPLLHEGGDHVMTHAGIPHIWKLKAARAYAREVEEVIRGEHFVRFFEAMYGNNPARWTDDVQGMDRHRVITNYFTRMRLIAADGTLDFSQKGTFENAPAGFAPWFRYDPRVKKPIVFGHWAALDGKTGSSRMLGIDTGCVWGRALTALRLDDGQRFEYWNAKTPPEE